MTDEIEDDIEVTTEDALEATDDADDATDDSELATNELPASEAEVAADAAELATELADDAVSDADDAALEAKADSEDILEASVLFWATAKPTKAAQIKCRYMATIVSIKIWRDLNQAEHRMTVK